MIMNLPCTVIPLPDFTAFLVPLTHITKLLHKVTLWQATGNSQVKAERVINQAREGISQAKVALSVSRDKAELESRTICEDAETKLKLAKDKVASGDYIAFLEANPIAEKSYDLANNALNTANREREHYQKRKTEKVKNAWTWVPVVFIVCPVLALLGGIGGCAIGLFTSDFTSAWITNWAVEGVKARAWGNFGMLLGGIIGLIFVIYLIRKELE